MSDTSQFGLESPGARSSGFGGQDRRAGDAAGSPPGGRPGDGTIAPTDAAYRGGTAVPLDVWVLADLVLRRWPYVILGAVVLGVAALAAGLKLWHNEYSVLVELIRYDSPNLQEVFPPRQTSPQTFATVMKSPTVMQRVSARANPPVSPDDLADSLRLIPERNSDLLTVSVTRDRAEGLVDLANLYARQAVLFTQQIQAQAAAEVNSYLTGQLAQVDGHIASLNQRLAEERQSVLEESESLVTTRPVSIEKLEERLVAAREALADLLGHYTEFHPLVTEQRAKIASLEKQLADLTRSGGTNTVAAVRPVGQGSDLDPPFLRPDDSARSADDALDLRSQLQTLESGRLLLASRQRAAQLFMDSPPGYYRLFSPASAKDMVVHSRKLKVAFLAIFGALAGALTATSVILLAEVLDNRLKTVADVARVTRLPLIAGLGDLRRMDPACRSRWAFRTWTALQHRLSPSPNHGLICGITSARDGEGRSTWVALLAQAATERGFRVLTIATRPSPAHTESSANATAPPDGRGETDSPPGDSEALTTNVLAAPAQVTQKLVGPDPQPHIHIPLPGWVWNLERRQQWQAALNHWRKINNIVILVELPPACVPEAILLAENVPNLLWLVDSHLAEAGETRIHLETLRHSRCHLVGALLNHESEPGLVNRFPRWFGGINGHPH